MCTDPSGQVVPMDMLDFEKERNLICDSLREAARRGDAEEGRRLIPREERQCVCV